MSKQETGFVLVNRISLFSHSPLQANENYKFLNIEKYESQTIISLNPDDDNADILFYKNLEDLIENAPDFIQDKMILPVTISRKEKTLSTGCEVKFYSFRKVHSIQCCELLANASKKGTKSLIQLFPNTLAKEYLYDESPEIRKTAVWAIKSDDPILYTMIHDENISVIQALAAHSNLLPILELLKNHKDLIVSCIAAARLYKMKKDKNYIKNISKIQYIPIFRFLSETHPLLNSPNYTNFGNEVIENDISKSGENSVPLFDTVDDLLKVYDKNTISCIYKVYASGQLINMPTDYNVFKSFRILKQM